MRYKFDSIAINSTTKKKPIESDKDTYLGLEHLDSGNLTVTRFGSEVAPIGEKLIMKKGDVLFGKRRAYQKKVAIAPFDGIFSAHGMVLRPKEDVVDESFFPLFISSDYFLEAAIKISVGSLSPTINWSALKDLEFELPSRNEQKAIAEILWAAIEAKKSYTRLLDLTEQLVKSQFIEMFGDPLTNPMGWEVTTIGGLSEILTGGTPSRTKPEYYEGDIPWVKTGEIEQGYIYDTEEHISEAALQASNCKLLPINTVMVAMYGQGKTRGQSGILRLEAATNQACAAVLPSEKYCTEFLYHYLQVQYEQLRGLGRGAQQANLNLSLVRNFPVPLPPLPLQNRFADFVKAADKSKFELQRTLDELEATYKALLREKLG